MSSNGVSHKLRSLTKESVVYGLAHVLTRSVTFLLLPYYSHKMTAGDYGELSLYYLFLAIVQTFYFYGLDISYLRFYNLSDHGKTKSQISGNVLLTTLVSSLGLSLLLAVFHRGIGSILIFNPLDPSSVPTNVLICIGILFFDTVSAFPFLKLRSDNRPMSFATQKLINVLINVGLNVWLIGGLNMGVRGVLWANLIASVVTTLLLLPGILRTCEFKFDKQLLRDMLLFGLPNIPTYLFVMIVELADRKALEIFRGVDEAGLYSAGYKLGMFMGVVNAAFRFAWQPFFLKHANDEHAPTLFSKTMTYYVLVSTALLVWLSLFVPPLVMTDLPVVGNVIAPAFWAGLSVFPIILAAHIFDGIYANLMVGIYLKKATRKLPAVTGAAAVFTIVANILLIPKFGMMAAAWITLVAFVIQAGLLYLTANKIYPIRYEWNRILLLFVLSGGITTIAAELPLTVSLRFALAVAFPVLLVLFKFFPENELRSIKSLIRG
ncbi:MAG: polysaccharide biosynthesis protein [Calditrichaeota bacterium]|nr:polysaccharide biosynthesis protein [Calditrichota bacterium]MCB9368326.1 polysaccharide biosynthesis protein [Calditrichota bacterium]